MVEVQLILSMQTLDFKKRNTTKMNTNKLFKLVAFIVITGLVITSCVEDKDFEVPQAATKNVEPNLNGAKPTTFNIIKAAYDKAVEGNPDTDKDNDPTKTVTFKKDLYITGYVISNDQAGNFYKELIIQNYTDATSTEANPRLGFRISINKPSLYQSFEFGRKVYIKLRGLTVGVRNGVLTIAKGEKLDQIQAYEFQKYILRSSKTATITPKVSLISKLTEADENTFVQLENVQFNKTQLPLTYAREPQDKYDGKRMLESCSESVSISVETSTFADFRSLPVAQGKGNIKGIFTRDFSDKSNVIVVNSASDIALNDTSRCDPVVLECSGATSTEKVVFEETFQSITKVSQLDALGWTNSNVSGGKEKYERNSFRGDTYLKISAFGTKEAPLEAWLVTPKINLDNTTEEELSFEISANYDSGKVLKAYITDDYTGDPKTTKWKELDVNIPIGPKKGFGKFVKSTINISCLEGNVNIAFKYLGNAGADQTRYHIDDIKITGK